MITIMIMWGMLINSIIFIFINKEIVLLSFIGFCIGLLVVGIRCIITKQNFWNEITCRNTFG